MSTMKYTKDGRKVAVIGKLNSEETIVQEIFVTDGQEYPAGENFVVKGLLDKPAESWKEKKLRETEERYSREMQNLESEFYRQSQRLKEAKQKASLRADALFSFAHNANEHQLDTLRAFLAGDITHLYIGGYAPKIVAWDDLDCYQKDDGFGGRMRIEGLKLVSLVGRSDGDLEYRLWEYSDGSGLGKKIYPFRSYEDALVFAQKKCDARAEKFVSEEKGVNFNMDHWLKIEGIRIPDAATKKHERQKEQVRQTQIADLKAKLAKLEDES